MQNDYVLTIAVPTYNGARTIRNMLDIMLPQCTEDVEVLISDNCSTDETPQIIAEYTENYPFIRTIRNSENIGADGNFLQCMQMANGRFVMLISDDDIVAEGAVKRIVEFLECNSGVDLAYMESRAFKDAWGGWNLCHGYKYLPPVSESFTTTDKKVFFKACTRLFGFTSSFVFKTDKIRSIDNPEQFFNTYFLQAYLMVCCSQEQDSLLGVIKGPCIGIGEYGIIGNYDVALVEGIYYHEMLEYAVARDYDRKLFEEWYIWKLCHLCRIWLIKQRAVGVHKMSLRNMFKASWQYPRAWVTLYPFTLLPNFLCRFILKCVRIKQGRNFTSYVNRTTD